MVSGWSDAEIWRRRKAGLLGWIVLGTRLIRQAGRATRRGVSNLVVVLTVWHGCTARERVPGCSAASPGAGATARV